MSTTISIVRARAATAALLIAALLGAVAVCRVPVTGASARLHDVTFTVPSGAVALERGASRGAEAAIDSLARALSGQQGYRPSSFATELYGTPTEGAASFESDLATAAVEAGWTPAPELASTGEAFRAMGWTHPGGRALVALYGQDAASGRSFVAILRATR